MSTHGGRLNQSLRAYKDNEDSSTRLYHALKLAALVAVFLERHEHCVGHFDLVVAVPSRKRREAVNSIVALVERLKPKYTQGTLRRVSRDPGPDEFVSRLTVTGKQVLLFDDTFTTGKSIAAAYRALEAAGAELVTPLVIGRHFHPTYEMSRPLWECLKRQQWNAERCGICAPVQCTDTLF